jgi:hypothetical protein
MDLQRLEIFRLELWAYSSSINRQLIQLRELRDENFNSEIEKADG